MSVIITDDCINCSACETECPEHAIMPRLNNHSELFGKRPKYLNNLYMAKNYQSFDHYYIIPGKCSECRNVYREPRCNSVCPVSCCITQSERDVQEHSGIKIKINSLTISKISLN